MAELSSGQKDALQDLIALQNASCYSIECLNHNAVSNGSLLVEISIECLGFEHRAPGLRLRDRERFWFDIGPQFPLEPPAVFAQTHRFAFNDHVYWAGELGVWLCLYYSMDHQWQPSQGIAGFIWHLLQWLERASVGELDAPGQPRHPPLAGRLSDDAFFVVRKDCPTFEHHWDGFAVLEKRGVNRFDLVDWTADMRRYADGVLAPAILLDMPFISEFPEYVSTLLMLLKKAGVDERILAVRLLLDAKNTKGRPPMYFVLGVAMRGPKGGTANQHLFIWKIPQRTANELRNLCRKYKRVNKRTLEYLLEKGETIVTQLKDSKERLVHCRVYDQRPAVSRRRDQETPLANLIGKSVTLWGAGGLGSHIAEMLIRSGVEKLRILDYGRVNPGLLVRQNYVDQDIGKPKVDALCKRLRAINPKAEIETIVANLLSDQRKVKKSLADTNLLIDATASRRVANIIDRYLIDNGVQNFAIAAVGNDINAQRGLITFTPANCRLGPTDLLHRTYLELCDQDSGSWLDAFWPQSSEDDWFEPEPGCSSPTFHGSGAQTASLAGSVLVEVARLAEDDLPPSVVGVSPFFNEETDIHFELEDPCRGVCPTTGNEVRFLSAASAMIDQTIAGSAKNKETGGVLFGFCDDYLKIVWVVASTGPPRDSEASASRFVCGVDGIAELAQEWCDKTHGLVGFLGTWHSHPVSRPTPSVIDLQAMKDLLRQSASPMHRLLLTIVGFSASTPEFGTYIFLNEKGECEETAREV